VVAKKHAEWGAELARKAGVSRRGVEIILRHQEALPGGKNNKTDTLLAALQKADNEN
jgi:hypothetical protein